MAKQDSFKKAAENAKNAGFKAAAKKLNVVNFAAEFGKRDIVLGGNNLEK